MLLNLFVVHRTSSITTNENKSVVLNIKKQTLVFCLLLFFFTNVCSSLFAQEYFTTVDWLNFVDVPSYLRATKLRILNPFYYVNQSTHETIIKEGNTVRYDDDIEAVFFIMCLNCDWKLSERTTLGILPVGTLGISPGGGGQTDLETWIKMKYLPLKSEDLFFRLAVKVPLYQPEDLKNQPDIDFAVLFSKSFSGLTPEVLFGYRYRFRTHNVDYQDWGTPGNEFHCRIGLDFPVGKDTRECIFLLGYFSQDKKEYFYTTPWPEQTLVYKKPYKMAVGLTLSHYFKDNVFFGKNNWYNITLLKVISWRNESGGWALVLSGKL